MRGNARRSVWRVWLVPLILIVTSPSAIATVSEANQAHRLTLQILRGMASCGDRASGPEYYATASRDDPEVERELNAVRREQASLDPRIEAFDERIEPLARREYNRVSLTADEQRELDELRYLRDQRDQRAPLADRWKVLGTVAGQRQRGALPDLRRCEGQASAASCISIDLSRHGGPAEVRRRSRTFGAGQQRATNIGADAGNGGNELP